MAKKVKINLTVSDGELWWSSDKGENWAIVGPKSPVTVVKKDYEIQWICEDSSIADIVITLDSGDVLETPSGRGKDITAKINSNASDKDVTKYSISVNGGAITKDPDAIMCKVEPCPPTSNTNT